MQAQTLLRPFTRRNWQMLLALGVLTAGLGGAWGQSTEQVPAKIDPSKAVAAKQQRRAALREALLAQRHAELPKSENPARQLSPAERAKLREQLRQQRREAQQDRSGPSR